MKSPAVSIVMGTYKRSSIIARTLKSILAQTYTDFEIVIVDDNHSTDTEEIDNTKKVMDGFKDPRIKYIKNHVNLGHPANFRKCFDQIRGKYFMLFSDDDELLEGALETMVNFLELNPTASLAHGYDTFMYPDGSSYKVPYSINETRLVDAKVYLNSSLLYDGEYTWSQSSVLYRTDFMRYNQIPIVDNYMWDSIFHSTYLLFSNKIGHINQYFCIRNEEVRYTGRNSPAFNFHAFIEVDYMMLRFINANEAILIAKEYPVNRYKRKIAWKMLNHFLHTSHFDHAIFCLKVGLTQLIKLYSLYVVWVPIKAMAIVYGKFLGLKHKVFGKKA